jgi:hypothetical protein
MKPRTTAELIVEIIASLSGPPKLQKQILIDLGIPPDRTERIAVHMRGLRDGGLIQIAGWKDQFPLLSFQYPPRSRPDVPRPAAKVVLSAPRELKRPAVCAMPSRPASAFNLGAL